MRTEPNHKNGLKKRTVLDENGLIWAEGGGALNSLVWERNGFHRERNGNGKVQMV